MARRRKKEDEGIKSNFDMLFLQLMMIMMAFFILLSALSIIIEEKRLKALDSIAEAFSLLPAGANLAEGQGGSTPSRESDAANAIAKKTAKELTNVAKLLGVGKAVHILPLDKSSVRVRMQEHILFESGQIQLNHDIRALLASMAEILLQPEIQQITIEGHTDRIPVRGNGAMGNWELSAARAMQIFLELAKYGIPRSKLVATGMGDTRPLPISETGGDEAMNRRVELLIRFRPTTSQEHQQTPAAGPAPAATGAAQER